MLADFLEIDCWACVVGGSLGGMHALQWAISYPKKIKNSKDTFESISKKLDRDKS